MSKQSFFKIVIILTGTCIFLLQPHILHAQSLGIITQTYPQMQSGIQNDQIVSTQTKSGITGVVLTKQVNDPNMVGVVQGNALITFGTIGSTTVPVASSGTVSVQVSDINGKIFKGDIITSSTIPGVGERDTSDGVILGEALQSFDQATNVTIKTITVHGTQRQIKEGTILLSIGIKNYQVSQFGGLIDSLNFLSTAMTGKQVNLLREMIAILVFFGGMIVFIYGVGVSIKHSLVSIGRNPLTKGTIIKTFSFILAILFGVLAICIVTSYLLFTL